MAAGALVIDHSQVLDYKVHLDYEPIRKDLVTLWGRINEVTEWSGVMNAYFDSRLEFDQDVPVLFESTWLRPDETKLAEYGVTVKQVEGNPYQWVFTVDKGKITAGASTASSPRSPRTALRSAISPSSSSAGTSR